MAWDEATEPQWLTSGPDGMTMRTKWSILSEQYMLQGPLDTPCTVHQDRSLQRHLELKSASRSLSLSLSLSWDGVVCKPG